MLATSGSCQTGVVVVNVTGDFDYIVTMEDLTQGKLLMIVCESERGRERERVCVSVCVCMCVCVCVCV